MGPSPALAGTRTRRSAPSNRSARAEAFAKLTVFSLATAAKWLPVTRTSCPARAEPGENPNTEGLLGTAGRSRSKEHPASAATPMTAEKRASLRRGGEAVTERIGEPKHAPPMESRDARHVTQRATPKLSSFAASASRSPA